LRRGEGKAGRQETAGATASSNLSSTLSAAAICPASFQKEDTMKGKLIFKLAALSTILSFLLAIPTLGQVTEDLGKKLCDYKAQTLKELKIAPEKEKALLAAEEKCVAERQKIFADLKKSKEDLQAALAAPKPDEAKIKDLVKTFVAAQTNLFNSFRNELKDELAQMSPIQQGKYLMAMERWRQDVCLPVH
jgi:Spy/CpxP family protein refolding chaperone